MLRISTFAVSALALLTVAGPLGAQDETFSLDGIVVTASPTPRSREHVATHVTVLSGEELRADGLRTVADALRDAAGADIVRTGSFGGITSLFLRGAESDHTLVLVDGVQVNQAGGSFDFAALTTDNVERIEILRGPASALYGSDAMAGVIHIVTRVGRGSPTVRAGMETAHYSSPRDDALDGVRWSADVSGGSSRFGYSASVSREEQDGILAFNNRFQNTVLSGAARFAPDDRTRVGLAVRLTDREFHDPTDGSGALADRNSFGYGDEMVAGLSAARSLSEVVELEARLSVSEVDGGVDDAPDDDADDSGFFSLDHFRRAVADVRANVSVRSSVLTLGVELEEERQRSFNESLSSFGESHGRSESERDNLAGFAHLTGEHGLAAFNVGGRLEDNERFGTGFTWQGGLSVHLPEHEGTRVRASIGTAIKEPSFFENFATGFVIGNPDLDPERSISWEVGIEHPLATGLILGATYFDQDIRDLIQYTSAPPSPGDPNYHNVAEASARGVEVDVELRRGSITAGAAYTWLDTEVTDSGFESGPDAAFVDGERLLRRPAHNLALNGSTAVTERGRIHTRVSVVGARADRSFDPVTFQATRRELPAYLLWSLGAQWELLAPGASHPSVSLTARAENLLDSFYTEAWGFRAPGRQLYFGMSLGLGGEA